MGALEQAPKHSTSIIVNLLSLVVCPNPIPKCEVIVLTIESEPHPPNIQGVVVQI